MTQTEYVGYIYRLHFLESLLPNPPKYLTKEEIEKEIKEIRIKLGRSDK